MSIARTWENKSLVKL